MPDRPGAKPRHHGIISDSSASHTMHAGVFPKEDIIFVLVCSNLAHHATHNIVSFMSEATNRIVGGILRDIRLDMGMSQAQVAARCGVRQPLISKVEHGDRELSAVEILPYAAALGISDERLYYEIRKALVAYAKEVQATRRKP